MMERASAARFSIPPDSSEGIRSSKPARLTTSSFMRDMMRIVFSSSRVWCRSGNSIFSATDIEPSSAPPWKATPILRRTLYKSRLLMDVMSLPKI